MAKKAATNSSATNGVAVPVINEQKSVIWAYFWWFFGGLFGLHHIYLRRDAHAFLWWSTLGGYFGIGWICEVFKIPRYVREANNDPKYVEDFKNRIKKNSKPPFSMNRFVGGIMVGYFWGSLIHMAIPEQEFGGVDWRFLYWLTPIGIGLGVWIVGNIGHEQGNWKWALLAAYISYPLSKYFILDETYQFTAITFFSQLAFDTYSKQWRLKPTTKRSKIVRFVTFMLCISLYLFLWSSYMYFNGKITDSEGNEVPVHEALHHFFTSPWWTDLKQSLYDVWIYAQHHGWYEVWKQIIDLTDPMGEQNAYKVLDLPQSASQAEITSKWRKLSREFHPDKVKDPDQQRAAQETFMEIQQAYEILSNSKTRRQKRNKQSNTD